MSEAKKEPFINLVWLLWEMLGERFGRAAEVQDSAPHVTKYPRFVIAHRPEAYDAGFWEEQKSAWRCKEPC